jgi:hypothetical protein
MHDDLVQFDFRHCHSISCLYIMKKHGELNVILYVDDCLVACKDKAFYDEVTPYGGSKYDNKILGKVCGVLGIDLVQSDDGINYYQPKKIY